MRNPFRYFETSPEIIRLTAMMYVGFPLSLRQVEDLLHERGIDICHETVRVWWNRFGPMFAAEIRKKRVAVHRNWAQWRWQPTLDYVRKRTADGKAKREIIRCLKGFIAREIFGHLCGTKNHAMAPSPAV